MKQTYMLPILYCQYHACWYPGDLSRRGISRYGIDQISWNIPSLASEEFKFNFKEEINTLYACFTW